MRSIMLLPFGLLVAFPAFAAQRYIVISDSLAAHSEPLKVKSGAQWMGRIHKWSFGDFGVVASKNKGTTETTKHNLLKTNVESTSLEQFSFVLANKGSDSASVTATHRAGSLSQQAVPLGNGWSLGTDQVLQESDSVTAVITVSADTSASWTLKMGGSRGRDADGGADESALTNGDRRIAIALATSMKPGEEPSRSPLAAFSAPAIGCEFIEDGRSLAALQYFGGTSGGPAAMYNYVVWIDRGLDPGMQLVLAAAMTTILQLKSQ